MLSFAKVLLITVYSPNICHWETPSYQEKEGCRNIIRFFKHKLHCLWQAHDIHISSYDSPSPTPTTDFHPLEHVDGYTISKWNIWISDSDLGKGKWWANFLFCQAESLSSLCCHARRSNTIATSGLALKHTIVELHSQALVFFFFNSKI